MLKITEPSRVLIFSALIVFVLLTNLCIGAIIIMSGKRSVFMQKNFHVRDGKYDS